jgi:phage baseplate assembly protein W
MPLIEYSDINLRCDKSKLTQGEAISRALYNSINIGSGDIYFRPRGCDLEEIIMEPLDEFAEFELISALDDCIATWDSRFTILRGSSTMTRDPDSNTININLVIEIIGEPGEFNISFGLPIPIEQLGG